MRYRTIVINHGSKVKKLAAAIEEKANELAKSGWELAAFSAADSSRAVLVFRVPGEEELPEEAAAPQAAGEQA